MGISWSSTAAGSTGSDPIAQCDYDQLYSAHSKLFPLVDDEDDLRAMLRDVLPTLVYSEPNGFNLYVGSAMHAQDISLLKKENITHIVNMAYDNLQTGSEYYGEGFNCLMVSAHDVSEYDLSQHFNEVSEFIENARMEGGSVLVHCMAGVSRSVTVTIAYLMKCCHMTLADACKLLRKTRKQSHPNMGFFQSLVELEQELKYNNTMNHYR